MRRKVTPAQKEQMQEWFHQGISVSEIARRMGVAWATAYGYTKAQEQGHASYHDYQEFLARRNGYSSYHAYLLHRLKERKFRRPIDYLDAISRVKGFKSYNDYQAYLAVKRGYSSYEEYRKEKTRERSQRPERQAWAALVQERVKASGKNLGQLAQEMDMGRTTLAGYLKGEMFPQRERWEKVCEVLQIQPGTLEDLMSNAP